MGDSYQKALVELRAGNWEIARDLVVKGATSEEQCGMCMWWLHDAHINGYWVTESKQLAAEWLNKAVATNHPVALAQAYHDKIIQLSNEQKEHIYCTNDSFSLYLYFRSQSYEYFYPWLLRAGLEGNIFAMGELFHSSDFGERNRWLQPAAYTGHAVSQLVYGDCLFEEENYAEAISWIKKSAAQGYVWAIITLVEDCYKHNHVAQLYWLRKLTTLIETSTESTSFTGYAKRGNVSKIMKENHKIFSRIDRCRAACLQLMCMRQFRQSDLSVLPKDVVRLIAKTLWKTWGDDTGAAAPVSSPKLKRIKM